MCCQPVRKGGCEASQSCRSKNSVDTELVLLVMAQILMRLGHIPLPFIVKVRHDLCEGTDTFVDERPYFEVDKPTLRSSPEISSHKVVW